MGGCVVDYHSAELFAERWFDLIIVLRTDNTVLYDRLLKRGYADTKLSNNIDCEIFGTILEEAQNSYKREIVVERRSDTPDEMQLNADWLQQAVADWVRNKSTPSWLDRFFSDSLYTSVTTVFHNT